VLEPVELAAHLLLMAETHGLTALQLVQLLFGLVAAEVLVVVVVQVQPLAEALVEEMVEVVVEQALLYLLVEAVLLVTQEMAVTVVV